MQYLEKVPEVKDTVHKQSLLYHLCNIVNEKSPESTDLYSEFGAVHRASRVCFYLRSKSMDWFLYDIGLRHERVK